MLEGGDVHDEFISARRTALSQEQSLAMLLQAVEFADTLGPSQTSATVLSDFPVCYGYRILF